MIVRTSCKDNAKAFEVQKDTVYIRSNIREMVDGDGDTMWEYEQLSMPLSEYVKKSFVEFRSDTDSALAELMLLISERQKQIDSALAELSILIGGFLSNV